jgi:hypothetical protein
MAEVLRPMSTGELMDRTFSLYKRNFKLFVGIATVGPATYLLFQLLTVGSAAVPAATGRRAGGFAGASFGIGMLAGVVIMLAGMAIAHAATVKAVAAVHLGLPITIGGAYKSLKGKLWRILGVFLCMILLAALAALVASIAIVIVTAIFAALGLVGGAQAGRASAIVTFIIGFSTIVIVGVFTALVWVRYALAIAACAVENLGVINSLKRSSALSKGSRFRVFVVYVVLVLLAALVGAALGGLAGAASMLIPNMVARLIVVYVASFVAGSLTGPLATIGIALVYYDERVRKEAFDLQWMMASLDAPAPAAAAVVPAQP